VKCFAGLGFCLVFFGCGPHRIWESNSPDRMHRIEVWQDGQRQFARMDGHDEPSYLAIGIDGVSWSPDAAQVAYPANTPAGWVVVAGGKLRGPWLGIGEIVWSPDGKQIAYSATEHRLWTVVRNSTRGNYYDAILQGSIAFSPDGTRLGYVVQDGRWIRAVVDEKPGPKFEGIGHLAFSADSRHHGYVARREGVAYVVVNGQSSSGYDAIADLVMAPKGFRWAILARENGRWHVVSFDDKGPAFDAIASPVFSPDGRRMAYAAKRRDNAVVVVDGIESAAFDQILAGSVVFDSTGEHLAFSVRQGKLWRVVVDGRPGKEHAHVGEPHLAGNSIAYVARTGRYVRAVVDNVEGPEFDSIEDLTLTSDGLRHGYTAKKNQASFVVVDSMPQKFDVIIEDTFVFSSDGRHWACLIGDAHQEKFYITVDGTLRIAVENAAWMTALLPDFRRMNEFNVLRPKSALRHWIAAELEKALMKPPTPLPSSRP
jgi:hypothetical protein